MAEPKGQKATRDRFAESVRPVIEQARQEGVTSFHGLADYLTERGIRPVTGKVEWSNAMVARLLARIKKLKPHMSRITPPVNGLEAQGEPKLRRLSPTPCVSTCLLPWRVARIQIRRSWLGSIGKGFGPAPVTSGLRMP
jgi:hypothetical protein